MVSIQSPRMGTHLPAAAFGLVSSLQSLRVPQYQKLGRHQVNRFPVLIEHRTSHGDDGLMRLGPRRVDFNNFTFDVQDVARTCRSWPGDFSAQADEAVRKWKTTCDEKPHCDCRSMPAARRQSLKDGCLGCAFINMEWLRIKFCRERLNPRRFHNIGPRCESLADAQILEIQLLHSFSHDPATSSSKWRFTCALTRLSASSIRWIRLIIRAPSSDAPIKRPTTFRSTSGSRFPRPPA